MLNFSFYLTITLLSLNQFTLISGGSGFNIYLFDIFLAFFSIYGLFYLLAVKKSFKLPKYSILFLLFSVYAGITLLASLNKFSQQEILVGFSYLIRLIIYLLGALVVFNMVDKKVISKETVLNTFVYSGVLISIIGFIQLIVLPDFSVLNTELGWDPHKNRLASSFFDPNFVGAYLVMCLVLLIDKMGAEKEKMNDLMKKLKVSKTTVLFFLIILLALFLTFSRSAWGMLAAVVLIYGLFKFKTLLIAFFFLSFLVYFAIPRVQTRISGITDPADSASLRIGSWNNTIRIIGDNFWIGTGFNTYRYVQQEYGFLTPDTLDIHSGAGSDSSILFVFATTGVIGLIIYLSAFLYPLLDSLRKKYEMNLIIVSVILGLFLESQFVNSLFYPQVMFLLFCILFLIPSRS